MPTELLALSWSVQVAVTSGYAAYMIAYRGIRAHHSAQDTLFLSLVFSLIASATLWITRDVPPPLAAFWSLTSSLAGGLFWRWCGMGLLANTLRGFDATWADDTPSAWVRLQDNREFPVSQLAVLLKDGTWLYCDQTAKFNDLPYAPCVLGTNGDVLMYLTSTKARDAIESKPQVVIDEDYGARLTYVPSSEVARVNIRLMKSINHRPKAAASPEKSSTELSVGYWLQLRRGLSVVLRKAAAAIS